MSRLALKRTSKISDQPVANGEPGVHHALIGAGFGLLLIYLARLIPFGLLRWAMIAVGALFVVVMTCYAGAVLWKRVFDYARPMVARVRRHVREDPQLGTLRRDTNARCWVAAIKRDESSFNVVIGEDDEPNPEQLTHARHLLSEFDALESRIADYLAREAEEEATSGDPALAAEIRALRISSFRLTSPANPGQVVIDFESSNEMRFWRCDYVNGELSGLGFDS